MSIVFFNIFIKILFFFGLTNYANKVIIYIVNIIDSGVKNMAEEYNPDIVSVIDEDGQEHTFEELDRIETDDGRYIALLPVYDDSQDIIDDDGEIIILQVEEEENGETYLCPIEDQKKFDEIGKLFEERLADLFFEDE